LQFILWIDNVLTSCPRGCDEHCLGGRPGLEQLLLTVARQHRTFTGFAIMPPIRGKGAQAISVRFNGFYTQAKKKSREKSEHVGEIRHSSVPAPKINANTPVLDHFV
jgi:hypothetical protein